MPAIEADETTIVIRTYIGNYQPRHEYLFDENLSRVYVYHIYEMRA